MAQTPVEAARIEFKAVPAPGVALGGRVDRDSPVGSGPETVDSPPPVVGVAQSRYGGPKRADDEFGSAAEAFVFTSHTPAECASPPGQDRGVSRSKAATPISLSVDAGRRTQGGFRALRRVTTASFSAGAMSLISLLTIGMTTSAEALPHVHAPSTTDVGSSGAGIGGDVQAYMSPVQGEELTISRDETYSVSSLVDLASAAGIQNFSDDVFSNDQTCAVQWPYAVGVPMTYGFGMRDGRMHQGTDFVPGAGAQIQAITDGVVRTSTDNGGAFGVTIVIDHVVDGQQISSRYAHMEYGSRQVQVGDTVRVGEYIGRTGNTGRSFGAHLHFEILRSGVTAVDPLPWLRANATC